MNKKDIRAGEILTEEYVSSIRPGYGMAPKHSYLILGKVAIQNTDKGTPFSFELIEHGID